METQCNLDMLGWTNQLELTANKSITKTAALFINMIEPRGEDLYQWNDQLENQSVINMCGKFKGADPDTTNTSKGEVV